MSVVLPATRAESERNVLARAWFEGFGMRHISIVLSFSFLVPVIGAVFGLLVDQRFQPSHLLVHAIECLVVGICAMASVVAVDNRLAGETGSAARGTVAVLAAAFASTALIEALVALLLKPLGLTDEKNELAVHIGTLHRVAFHFAGSASWSLLLVAVYSMFETDRRATDDLHAANVAAFAAERNLIEGNLRAMQARVDPDLLFDTLLEVDRAYAAGIQSGEAALDALIAFLRAALPELETETSTVSKELNLVDAYMAVLALRPQARHEIRIRSEPTARDAAMPAMLLLPLVRWALVPSRALRLELTVRRGASTLEFLVRTEGPEFAQSPQQDIESVHERLRNLFGERARIRLSAQTDARQAVMEIPV